MDVLIVSGGNIDIEFLKDVLKSNYDSIIAVDKGLESLHKLNKTPNAIVGDFDSVSKDLIKFYENKNIPINAYKSEKDFTDTELGLDLAISLNPDKITIVGAIGTRLDHTLSNVHILTKCLEKNIVCEMIDSYNKVYLINNKKEIEKKNCYGKFFSIIPLTSEVQGITLKGFKYPLENYTLSIGKSLGISNEIVENTVIVEVKSGILIAIESKD